MSYDYSGKIVAVTGGTGVLGGAVANAYLEARAQVVISERSPKGEGAKGGNSLYLQMDAQSEESVRAFFNEVQTRFGRLDALVNVIGGYKAGDSVSDLSLDDFQSQLDLNLKSAFLVTKYGLQALEEKGGSIVHVSSRAAVDNGKNAFAYSASKLGVLRLVEAVAAESKKKNITINAVLPSIFDTPANRQGMPDADFEKWPKAEQIAKVILFLTSPDAELISGAAIPVYGKA